MKDFKENEALDGKQVANRTATVIGIECGKQYNDSDGTAWLVLNKTETSKSITRNYKKNDPNVYLTFKAQGDLPSTKEKENTGENKNGSSEDIGYSNKNKLKLLISIPLFVILVIVLLSALLQVSSSDSSQIKRPHEDIAGPKVEVAIFKWEK